MIEADSQFSYGTAPVQLRAIKAGLVQVQKAYADAPGVVQPHLLPLLRLQEAIVAYLEHLESQR